MNEPAQRPPPPWRFRWGIVWVVLAILATARFLKVVDVAFEWEDIMDFLNVHDRERYTRLAVFGLVLIAVCAIARILLKGRSN